MKKNCYGVLTVSAKSKSAGNPDVEADDELQRFGFRPEEKDCLVSEKGRPSQGERFILEVLMISETAGTFNLFRARGKSWEEVVAGRVVNRTPNNSAGLCRFDLVGGCFSKLVVICPVDAIAEDIEAVVAIDPSTLVANENISIDAKGNEVVGEDRVLIVHPDLIRAFADQPRRYFNREKLDALAESIVEWGQQRPAVVRLIEENERGESNCLYELIGGERRWRGIKSRWEMLQRKGVKGMKVIVRKGGDVVDRFTMAFMDNLQSEPPTPYENVMAIHWFMDKLGDIAEIKRRTGFDVQKIKDYLKLKALHPDILELMSPEVPEEKRLRIGHARMLATIESHEEQRKIYERAYMHSDHGIQSVGRLVKAHVAKKRTLEPMRRKDIKKLVARAAHAIIHGVIDLNGHYSEFKSWLLSLDPQGVNEIEGSLRSAADKIPRLLAITEEISRDK